MKQDLLLYQKEKAVEEAGFAKEVVKDIPEDQRWWKADVCIAVDNQRLLTEISTDMSDEMKVATIDIVYQTMLKCLFPKIVSCQSMLGPVGLVHWPLPDSDEMGEEPIKAATRFLDMRYKVGEFPGTEALAEQFARQIDHEVLNDLLNNAGQRLIWDVAAVDGRTMREKVMDLIAVVKRTRQVIKAQSKRDEANWCVTSPMSATLLQLGGMDTPYQDFHSLKGITEVGSLMGMRVWCVPELPPMNILMGYKGDHPYDAGYIYSPYCALSTAKVDGDGVQKFLTRYAKKLRRGGSNYYAKIAIDNL